MNRAWVVLKGIWTGSEWKFQEQGPFSEQEVLAKLYSGDLDFQDFAWQEGMLNWKHIAELHAFASSRSEEWRSGKSKRLSSENSPKLPVALKEDNLSEEKPLLRPTRAQLLGWDKGSHSQRGFHSEEAPTESDGIDCVSCEASSRVL